jgi:hypothetical protein
MNTKLKESTEKTAAEPEVVDTRWSTYKKRGTVEARLFSEGEELPKGCSVSQKDKDGGSPKGGDWIARDRDNPEDTWLISRKFFEDNYERA